MRERPREKGIQTIVRFARFPKDRRERPQIGAGVGCGAGSGLRRHVAPGSGALLVHAGEAVSTALQPATQVPGLIKAGLQPRPFSPIQRVETATVEKVPAGFVKMPGGEVRPRFGA